MHGHRRIFALTWWQGALGELHATLQAQRLPATGASGGLYAGEIFQHGRGAATVFIAAEGSIRAVGRVVSLVIPSDELAVTRRHGSPAGMNITYGALGAYVMKHKISVESRCASTTSPGSSI